MALLEDLGPYELLEPSETVNYAVLVRPRTTVERSGRRPSRTVLTGQAQRALETLQVA